MRGGADEVGAAFDGCCSGRSQARDRRVAGGGAAAIEELKVKLVYGWSSSRRREVEYCPARLSPGSAKTSIAVSQYRSMAAPASVVGRASCDVMRCEGRLY